MALYYLTYDLRKQKDYQKLYDELKKFQAVKVLKSTWCFNRLYTTPLETLNYFKGFIDSDDGLSVEEVSNWATFNTEGSPNDLK